MHELPHYAALGMTSGSFPAVKDLHSFVEEGFNPLHLCSHAVVQHVLDALLLRIYLLLYRGDLRHHLLILILLLRLELLHSLLELLHVGLDVLDSRSVIFWSCAEGFMSSSSSNLYL